jgi:hypothetical protein
VALSAGRGARKGWGRAGEGQGKNLRVRGIDKKNKFERREF